MIEDPDVYEVERIAQGAGQQLVCGAGLGCAGRVVVGENDGGGVVFECQFYDFARVNAGLGQRGLTSEQLQN
jgi:hypothetical protein